LDKLKERRGLVGKPRLKTPGQKLFRERRAKKLARKEGIFYSEALKRVIRDEKKKEQNS
jgi:hypothetical protein